MQLLILEKVHKRSRSHAGLSLIEIIVALAVLSVSALAVMGLFPVAADAARRAEDLHFAGSVAASDLEMCRGSDFESVDDTSYNRRRNGTYSSGCTDFRVFRRVSLGPVEGLKIIEVQVEWGDDPKRLPNRYTLETAIHKVFQ